MKAVHTVANEIEAGAEAVRALMGQIGEISDATCTGEGSEEGKDTRDYAAMTNLTLGLIHEATTRGDAYREGIARALAHLLCVNADGCGIDQKDWQPIRDTATIGGYQEWVAQ